MSTYWQDPQDVRLYAIKYSWWPLTDGEEISAAEFDVSPEGLDVVLVQINTNGDVIARISGGVPGSEYEVTCHATTSAAPPQEMDVTLDVVIRSTSGG
jgi:hypothetical protein